MSRRSAALLLLTTAAMTASAAASLALPAVSASAVQTTTGSISIQYAPQGVSPSSNVGQVSVGVAATSRVTSMTVSVYSGVTGFGCTGGTDVLDLPLSDFVQPANDGNGQLGIWTLAIPISTSQLPLGGYQVCATAADQGGDTTDAYVGPLYYYNTVEFPTFTASGTSFSFDNQDVTLSGTAELLTPGGATSPFAGKTLTVAGGGINPTTVTGADGSFSVKFQVPSGGPYWVYYNNDGSTTGSSSVVNLTFTTFPVHLTATLSATKVNQGKKVTVSGTVTYKDKGVNKPLAGNTVWLCSSGDPYPCASTWSSYASGSAVTNSSGKFTMRVPTQGSDVWTLQTTQTLYFPVAKVTRSLSVAQINSITGFRAKLDSFGAISYSGCVTALDGGIGVEYAAKPTGPWHRLKVKPIITGTVCAQGQHYGQEFAGTTVAQLAAAYYRAVIPATSQWQAATSRTLYLWKYLTKITSFSVTPRHVAKGGHIRVSGRLWTDNGHNKWRPYAHHSVIVVFKFRGTWYRYRGEPKTDRTGRFSGRFPVYASSPFFAQYNGDKLHFACASAIRKVTSAALAFGARLGPAFRMPRLRLPTS